MPRRYTTYEEANEIWNQCEELWNRMFHTPGPPWVKAEYVLNAFNLTLKQQGLKLDPNLKVAKNTKFSGIYI